MVWLYDIDEAVHGLTRRNRSISFISAQGETPAPIDLINDASSPATNRSNTSKEPRTANKTDNLEVIDLTEGPDVEIISSSVQKSKPRLFKRPRAFSEQALPVLKKSAMSVQRPAEPESPKGPKCGICLEKMGSSGKNMVAGPCG